MMIKRIRQFFRAITAKLTPEDHQFISSVLTPEELGLFKQMQPFDQYHCLRVTYSLKKLLTGISPSQRAQLNTQLLYKAGLLHDIGRSYQYIILADKIIAVLLASFAPSYISKLASAKLPVKINTTTTNPYWGGLWRLSARRYALYLYYHHARYSAKLLSRLSTVSPELISLVAAHHSPPLATDSLSLQLLRMADELN